MGGKLWTQQENDILREHYRDTPTNLLVPMLPGRTYENIQQRAIKLGLKRAVDWTAQEDALLREHYCGTKLSKLLPMFPGKSEAAIRQHALKIGLRIEKVWTCTEDALLKRIYPQGTKKNIRTHINEPWPIIYHRAKVLGITRDREVIKQEMREAGKLSINPDAWTPAEIATLKSKYPTMSKTESEALFSGRSWIEVRRKAVKLGLSRDKTKINKDRDHRLKKTLKEKYGVDCSLKIPAVKKKIREERKVGISKEELRFLKYLLEIDPETKHHIEHPQTGETIDYYMPKEDLWIQYDGVYWHGKSIPTKITKQYHIIQGTVRRDEEQLREIPNLIRFWSDEVVKHRRTVTEHIKERIELFRTLGVRRLI